MTPSGPPAARRPVLTIDVGGTKIAAAVVTADGRVVRRTTVPIADLDPSSPTWARRRRPGPR